MKQILGKEEDSIFEITNEASRISGMEEMMKTKKSNLEDLQRERRN